jgi:hypothetical protein
MGAFWLAQVVIITLHGGWSASSFGGRMYLSSLPFFAVLLAALYDHWLSNKLLSVTQLVGIVSSVVIFNALSMIQFVGWGKFAARGGVGTELPTRQRLNRFLEKTIGRML